MRLHCPANAPYLICKDKRRLKTPSDFQTPLPLCQHYNANFSFVKLFNKFFKNFLLDISNRKFIFVFHYKWEMYCFESLTKVFLYVKMPYQ